MQPEEPLLNQASWQDALDSTLVQRLMRPVVQPGLIRPQLAQATLARVQTMLNRVPLATELTQRLSVNEERQAGQVPIVYAQRVWRTAAAPPGPRAAGSEVTPTPSATPRPVVQPRPQTTQVAGAAGGTPALQGAPLPVVEPTALRRGEGVDVAAAPGKPSVPPLTALPVVPPRPQAPALRRTELAPPVVTGDPPLTGSPTSVVVQRKMQPSGGMPSAGKPATPLEGSSTVPVVRVGESHGNVRPVPPSSAAETRRGALGSVSPEQATDFPAPNFPPPLNTGAPDIVPRMGFADFASSAPTGALLPLGSQPGLDGPALRISTREHMPRSAADPTDLPLPLSASSPTDGFAPAERSRPDDVYRPIAAPRTADPATNFPSFAKATPMQEAQTAPGFMARRLELTPQLLPHEAAQLRNGYSTPMPLAERIATPPIESSPAPLASAVQVGQPPIATAPPQGLLDPSNGGVAAHGAQPKMDLDELTDRVLRKFWRQLAVESERRGWRR